MFKTGLTEEDKRKIISVAISSLSKGVSILSIDGSDIKIIICNDGRNEDEVDRLAREFKVQMLFLAGDIVGLMPDFKLKYKSVDGVEYRRIQHEVVEKYRYLLQ